MRTSSRSSVSICEIASSSDSRKWTGAGVGSSRVDCRGVNVSKTRFSGTRWSAHRPQDVLLDVTRPHPVPRGENHWILLREGSRERPEPVRRVGGANRLGGGGGVVLGEELSGPLLLYVLANGDDLRPLIWRGGQFLRAAAARPRSRGR